MRCGGEVEIKMAVTADRHLLNSLREKAMAYYLPPATDTSNNLDKYGGAGKGVTVHIKIN